MKGLPIAMAKRPTTGTLPSANTAARENFAPAPLLAKVPVAQTPLAWLRRKPGCTPFSAWKRSMMRAWVSSPGVRYPPV